MTNSSTPNEKRLEMYETMAEDHPDSFGKNDIEILESLCESEETKIKALNILAILSTKQPALTLPAISTIYDISQSSEEHPQARAVSALIVQNVRNDPDVKELFEQLNDYANKQGSDRSSQSTPTTDNPVRMAENARNETVTAERLNGNERHFYDVTPFLQSGEQPHFVFALSASWGVKHGCFTVDKSGSEENILDRKVTGSVVVTDHGVRIISEEGRWALSYRDITSSNMEAGSSRYTPTLKIVAAGEIYRAKTAKSIHSESEVSSASRYINNRS